MKKRAFIIPAVGVAALLLGFVVFNLLNSNLVYFKTPTEVLQEGVANGDRMRLGGEVMPGSVVQLSNGVEFDVGDGVNAIKVVHQGAPSQLFQEGIGVVVEGEFAGGVFHSDTMLVKHDDQYRSEDGGTYKPPTDPTP